MALVRLTDLPLRVLGLAVADGQKTNGLVSTVHPFRHCAFLRSTTHPSLCFNNTALYENYYMT